MCMICFLTDNFQEKLRCSSQIQSDRYEHSILNYKKNFISEFQLRKSSPLCEKHKDNTDVLDILKKINLKLIDEAFDTLKDIYIYWIDSNPTYALKNLNEFLVNKNLLDCTTDINKMIFFRGRNDEKVLSHWDMFHIPFNKRYIIANQRYSLVGQPLLYLALTPLGVLKELNSKYDNLKISTFYFKENVNKKIFDLRNNFSKLIDDTSNTSNLIDNMIIHEDTINYKKHTLLIREFFKLILSSCCSFEKRKEYSTSFFCEEYVLPQILAQVLKQNNFDGILYSSTKINVTNNDFVTFYRDNLALFTHYDSKQCDDEKYVYDRDLYSQFKISTPICINRNVDVNSYTIDIDDIINLISRKDFYKSVHLKKIIAYNIMNYMDLDDLDFEGEMFLDTLSGKFYQIMLSNIFMKIKNDFLYDISLKGV